MTPMKKGTTNHRPLTTRSAFLSAAFARATAGGLWVSGLGLSDFVSFVVFCKNLSARRGRRVYGFGKPASLPRRIRVAAATGRGTLAPRYGWLEKTRRRLHGAAQIEPACYRELPATAKLHRDLVRAVPSARYAHPIRIGSLPIAVDVIGIETTVVRHGDNQRAVAIDVDETRGGPTPEEVHLLQAVHFVTTRVQRDLHRCRCRCRRCSRRRGWCGCRARTHRAVEDFHVRRRRGGLVAACQPNVVSAIGIGREVAPSVNEWLTECPGICHRVI